MKNLKEFILENKNELSKILKNIDFDNTNVSFEEAKKLVKNFYKKIKNSDINEIFENVDTNLTFSYGESAMVTGDFSEWMSDNDYWEDGNYIPIGEDEDEPEFEIFKFNFKDVIIINGSSTEGDDTSFLLVSNNF